MVCAGGDGDAGLADPHRGSSVEISLQLQALNKCTEVPWPYKGDNTKLLELRGGIKIKELPHGLLSLNNLLLDSIPRELKPLAYDLLLRLPVGDFGGWDPRVGNATSEVPYTNYTMSFVGGQIQNKKCAILNALRAAASRATDSDDRAILTIIADELEDLAAGGMKRGCFRFTPAVSRVKSDFAKAENVGSRFCPTPGKKHFSYGLPPVHADDLDCSRVISEDTFNGSQKCTVVIPTLSRASPWTTHPELANTMQALALWQQGCGGGGASGAYAFIQTPSDGGKGPRSAGAQPYSVLLKSSPHASSSTAPVAPPRHYDVTYQHQAVNFDPKQLASGGGGMSMVCDLPADFDFSGYRERAAHRREGLFGRRTDNLWTPIPYPTATPLLLPVVGGSDCVIKGAKKRSLAECSDGGTSSYEKRKALVVDFGLDRTPTKLEDGFGTLIKHVSQSRGGEQRPERPNRIRRSMDAVSKAPCLTWLREGMDAMDEAQLARMRKEYGALLRIDGGGCDENPKKAVQRRGADAVPRTHVQMCNMSENPKKAVERRGEGAVSRTKSEMSTSSGGANRGTSRASFQKRIAAATVLHEAQALCSENNGEDVTSWPEKISGKRERSLKTIAALRGIQFSSSCGGVRTTLSVAQLQKTLSEQSPGELCLLRGCLHNGMDDAPMCRDSFMEACEQCDGWFHAVCMQRCPTWDEEKEQWIAPSDDFICSACAQTPPPPVMPSYSYKRNAEEAAATEDAAAAEV